MKSIPNLRLESLANLALRPGGAAGTCRPLWRDALAGVISAMVGLRIVFYLIQRADLPGAIA